MPKRESDSESYNRRQIFFPTGSLHYIAAVMSMLPAVTIMWLLCSLLLLSGYEVGLRASVSMAGIVALTLVLAHPTFILIKGRRWPRPFLRWLNIFCMLILVVAAFSHLLMGNESQFLVGAVGLAFALVAFKLYRSVGFSRFCDHFCFLWDAHRKKLRRIKADRLPNA